MRRVTSGRINAVLIAAYSHILDPKETRAVDLRLDGLCDQLTFIEQVEVDIARLKMHLGHIRDPHVRTMVTADTEILQAHHAAALPAAFRWNGALNALYGRLIERGKPQTVPLVACARKLLVFANTVIARGTPWTTRPTAA